MDMKDCSLPIPPHPPQCPAQLHTTASTSLSVELKCLDCSQKSLLPSNRPSCCLLGPVAVILFGTVLSCVLCCLWHRVVFCTVLSSVLCCPVCRVLCTAMSSGPCCPFVL